MTAINISLELEDAINACEAHCNGTRRDTSLTSQFDNQVQLFRSVLQQMLSNVERRQCIPLNEGLAYSISDCWPYESWLGKKIANAEENYEKFARQSPLKPPDSERNRSRNASSPAEPE